MKKLLIPQTTAQSLVNYFMATDEGALMAALIKGLEVIPDEVQDTSPIMEED